MAKNKIKDSAKDNIISAENKIATSNKKNEIIEIINKMSADNIGESMLINAIHTEITSYESKRKEQTGLNYISIQNLLNSSSIRLSKAIKRLDDLVERNTGRILSFIKSNRDSKNRLNVLDSTKNFEKDIEFLSIGIEKFTRYRRDRGVYSPNTLLYSMLSSMPMDVITKFIEKNKKEEIIPNKIDSEKITEKVETKTEEIAKEDLPEKEKLETVA